MTGPEHYTEAERYLALLNEEKDPEGWREALRTGELALGMQAAQVHATLALAAATAMNDATGGMGTGDWAAWRAVASVDAPSPEVTG